MPVLFNDSLGMENAMYKSTLVIVSGERTLDECFAAASTFKPQLKQFIVRLDNFSSVKTNKSRHLPLEKKCTYRSYSSGAGFAGLTMNQREACNSREAASAPDTEDVGGPRALVLSLEPNERAAA